MDTIDEAEGNLKAAQAALDAFRVSQGSRALLRDVIYHSASAIAALAGIPESKLAPAPAG